MREREGIPCNSGCALLQIKLTNCDYNEFFHYNEQTINAQLIAVDIKTGQI
jgi:hypothetical protein